ncbi:MAG: hypothetical protein ACKO4W_02335 [Bacteroidota bacterium]
MTEEKHISELLEKYWEGETSLSEERELKTYFSGGDVYPLHKEYESYFKALVKERQVKAPARFHVGRAAKYWLSAASIALLIVAGWFLQKPATSAPVADNSQKTTTENTKIPVIGPEPVLTSPSGNKPTPAKTRKTRQIKTVAATADPETQEALIQVKAALALVSSSLKKTRREVSKGAGHLEAMDLFHKRKGG